MRGALLPFLVSARATVLLMAAAIAVAVAVVVSVLALSKPADARATLVTKSFSNPGTIFIPEGAPTFTKGPADPYPSSITSSFPGGSTVRDANLTLKGYTHTFPGDVDVLLVHGELNRTILSDAGGSHDIRRITLKLDDEAVNGPVSDSNKLTSGTFPPANYQRGDRFNVPAPDPADQRSSLSGFNGSSARGSWKLFVLDDVDGDPGSFARGWTIQITAAVPQ